jgi:hypothetical protein
MSPHCTYALDFKPANTLNLRSIISNSHFKYQNKTAQPLDPTPQTASPDSTHPYQKVLLLTSC